ncbi:MAG: Oxygen regulatory protein NreC [Paracidovorax wautersii]|uniref:Oxygen regulatory protein NreC n=1 Tax=Paracidovorax wautersii TaxID=1177982 RepID=A0A7V8JQS7_9BURK|nr:MAG: Oxygen regulatory protein NreC [Paracidovorax wautersii]
MPLARPSSPSFSPPPEPASTVPAPVRVLLVDDHPLVRDGIRMRLEAAPGIVVVGEAANVDDAFAAVAQTEPDIVITDIRMPGRSGVELAADLSARFPDVRVVVLSMLKHAEYVHRALALGPELRQLLSGYLPAAVSRKPLTEREAAVLKLLAQGQSSKAIAEALGMSVRTVETHRLHLRRKLHLQGSTPLVNYAADFSDLAFSPRGPVC